MRISQAGITTERVLTKWSLNFTGKPSVYVSTMIY